MSEEYVTGGSKTEGMWLYILGGLGCVIATVGSILLLPSVLKTFLYPQTNLILFFIGAVALLINSIFAILDAGKIYKTERAIQFDSDHLYVFQHFRKIKIRYTDILEVGFIRVPVGRKSNMTIVTKAGKTKLLIGDTSSVAKEFQNLQITTKTNATPATLYALFAFGFVSIIIFPNVTGVALLLAIAAFLVAGYLSKRGHWSRHFELSCILLPIGFPLLLFAAITPLNTQDKDYQALMRLRRHSAFSDVVRRCGQIPPDSHPKLLNLCAWTLVTTSDPALRNYPLATKFATGALARAGNIKLKNEIADTLACAHMAQGHREDAMKLAREYSLTIRSQEFSNSNLCKEAD